ncbi:hypothetical protein BU26DRAFT_126417 [Trematosphaeria pertusa]|uniref:Uncharacterized protein n=1 Tax=Trematosphaeria pertusa TaxID=390896 RepID=A0A6A6HY02_9PLEO|nr:uncharacterized protein BU26DRAFT_126417 [Trematosphaeria pertusa]KAF2243094.1 hypothetical protein BU26DRAFT_126417 [Trematosphaeria pertusa]
MAIRSAALLRRHHMTTTGTVIRNDAEDDYDFTPSVYIKIRAVSGTELLRRYNALGSRVSLCLPDSDALTTTWSDDYRLRMEVPAIHEALLRMATSSKARPTCNRYKIRRFAKCSGRCDSGIRRTSTSLTPATSRRARRVALNDALRLGTEPFSCSYRQQDRSGHVPCVATVPRHRFICIASDDAISTATLDTDIARCNIPTPSFPQNSDLRLVWYILGSQRPLGWPRQHRFCASTPPLASRR